MKLMNIHRHNLTLLDGIISLYEQTNDHLTEETRALSWPPEWSEKVIRSQPFQKWLESMGVVGPIGKPMQGGVGRAYPIGKDYIVKFTPDQKEAQAAAILKGHNSKHAADVYGVHRVLSMDKDGRRVHLFAIVMQRLNTGVGSKMRAAGNAVYQYLDDNSGFIEDIDAVIRVVMAKYVDEKSRQDKGMRYAVEKVVRAIHDVQEKTGVLSQDPHGGNIAFKGREPALFDFGRSSVNFDHPKVDGARITALPEK